jgi:hypothetical protein
LRIVRTPPPRAKFDDRAVSVPPFKREIHETKTSKLRAQRTTSTNVPRFLPNPEASRQEHRPFQF